MRSLRSDHLVVLLGLATFCWALIFVWQGLDFTDMGFWLTGYQQFYTHPEVGWGLCWLTNFFGHWTGVFLGGEVVAYRIGYVLVVTASAILSYQLLSIEFGKDYMLAATIFLTALLARSCQTNWIGYNELTALFYLMAVMQLHRGLVYDRKSSLILAGVVLGANAFVRLPNVLGISMVLAIWFYALICRWPLRKMLGLSVIFCFGFCLGIAIIVTLIMISGHETVVIKSLQGVLVETGNHNTHHASSGLIRRLFNDHIRAFIEGAILIVLGGCFANWVSRQKEHQKAASISVGAAVLFFVFYCCDHWQWFIPGFCYITLLFILLGRWRKEPEIALLACETGLILFLAPLGSLNGITNSVFGMWLALPLSLNWLIRCTDPALQVQSTVGFGKECVKIEWSLLPKGGGVLVMTVAVALLTQSLVAAWRYTFRDCVNRYNMHHSIKQKFLTGTFTTVERANVVNELLDAMSMHTRPGDAVLAYNGMSAIFFLTETYPWTGLSWPDFEGFEKNSDLIWQREKDGSSLPCVVRAKASTYVNTWPASFTPLSTFWRQEESRRAFAEFEKRHGYQVAWSNSFFEILMPNKDRTE